MFQEIYVIDEQEELTEELKKMFKEEPNYRFKRILTKDMDYVSNNLPQLIIINDDTITKNTIELCTEIRKQKHRITGYSKNNQREIFKIWNSSRK